MIGLDSLNHKSNIRKTIWNTSNIPYKSDIDHIDGLILEYNSAHVPEFSPDMIDTRVSYLRERSRWLTSCPQDAIIEEIRTVVYLDYCSEMSDNFYFTNGRKKRSLEDINRLKHIYKDRIGEDFPETRGQILEDMLKSS
jgi:hypothetical protein